MRIAVYHNLPSGGAKRSLFEMVRGLADKHEIDVYTLSCAEHEFADIRPFVNRYLITPFTPQGLLGSPFGRLNQLIYLADLLRLDRTDKRLAGEIEKDAYDVVFVHHCRYRQSPAIMRYLETPTVYYCQEPPRKIYDPSISRPYEGSDGFKKRLDRLDPLPRLYMGTLRRRDWLNVQSSAMILVNSYHSRENVWRVYGKEPTVCYLGVDLQEFQPISCSRENMVLSVGTVNPIKGHDLLIQAIGRLPDRNRPSLVIISNFSDGRERAYLEQLADQHKVCLQIKPIINDSSELATWYSRARVTGYTPVLEPLGLVSLESMACGTPLVGVREGGVRETVVDGVTGRLADRDPAAVAEALNDLLSHPAKAAEMGRQGRAWVEQQWSWLHTVNKVEQALEQVTTKPK